MSNQKAQAAWREFSERIGKVGELVEGLDSKLDDRLRAEGYRYLSRLAQFALQWNIEFAHPTHPAFVRFGDDVMRWGAPNADNTYLRAKVDAAHTYRVTGNLDATPEVLFSIQSGDMALGAPDVLAELTLTDLQLGQDGDVELVVGGTETGPNWLPLPPRADHLLVRAFVADWQRDNLADFIIERVDHVTAGTPAITQDALAQGLDRAATWVERSTAYWRDYYLAIHERGAVNTLRAPQRPEGGAIHMLHGGGTWNLSEGEALLIETELPEATYWSYQCYSPWWMETLDFTNHTTSLNNRQVHVDSDGRARIILADRDPGVQNWLDTTGLTSGLLTYRYVRPTTSPSPACRLIQLSDLHAALPADTPVYTPDQRRHQIAARRNGIARRFRR